MRSIILWILLLCFAAAAATPAEPPADRQAAWEAKKAGFARQKAERQAAWDAKKAAWDARKSPAKVEFKSRLGEFGTGRTAGVALRGAGTHETEFADGTAAVRLLQQLLK